MTDRTDRADLTRDLVKLRFVTEALSRGSTWATIGQTLGYGTGDVARRRVKREIKALAKTTNRRLATRGKTEER